MENVDREGHFKKTITLALNKNIPWETLASILHEMTPTLEETNQLISSTFGFTSNNAYNSGTKTNWSSNSYNWTLGGRKWIYKSVMEINLNARFAKNDSNYWELWKHIKEFIQGDPNQNLLFQLALSLNVGILDPKLVKPKCVWEVEVLCGKIQFLEKLRKNKNFLQK